MLVRIRMLGVAVLLAGLSVTQSVSAQPVADGRLVHIIWMGGNDCPPCVAWRREELPRLKQSPQFGAVRFIYVEKRIKSPVPSRFFLPDEIKPFKDLLDEASAGRHGSPQAAVLVDGKLHDYFHGTRTAAQIESMIGSIRTGSPYPFTRCLKVSRKWRECAVTAD